MSGQTGALQERWAVGVDVGGTKMKIAAVGADGTIHHRVRRPTPDEAEPEGVEERIVAAVDELREQVDLLPVGVGIGIAGQVRAEQGVVHFAPNLEWHDVAVRPELRERLDLPVTVTNDVRAATWGEWLYGAGRGCDNLVCLFIGTGIGGGVVCGGEMHTGCTNCAGELGHITIDMNGPLCHCGNRGCLEAWAGGWAIARQAREAAAAQPLQGLALRAFADGDNQDQE